MLSTWLHHCGSSSLLPYSSMLMDTSLRTIFVMRYTTSIAGSHPNDQIPHT